MFLTIIPISLSSTLSGPVFFLRESHRVIVRERERDGGTGEASVCSVRILHSPAQQRPRRLGRHSLRSLRSQSKYHVCNLVHYEFLLPNSLSHSKVVIFEAQLFLFSDLLVLSNGNHYDYKDCTGILTPIWVSWENISVLGFCSKSLKLLNPILLGF